MIELALWALLVITMTSLALWLVSLKTGEVSVVDVFWPLFHLIAAFVYFFAAEPTLRGTLVLLLIVAWAVRLSVFIATRNAGRGEDARYQAIRENNEPNFRLKSLYIVFGLQAVLAFLTSLVLLPIILNPSPMSILDWVGLAVAVLGLGYETIADTQLAAFRASTESARTVLRTGL